MTNLLKVTTQKTESLSIKQTKSNRLLPLPLTLEYALEVLVAV